MNASLKLLFEFGETQTGYRLKRAVWVASALLVAMLLTAPRAAGGGGEVASMANAFGPGGATSCDGQWHTVPAVDPETEYGDFSSLNGVAALSPTDIWAVGEFHRFADNSLGQPLIEHWDGTSWTLVSSPTPARQISVLNAVSALAPNDIWAIGYEQDIGFPYLSLIEHWDGSNWTIVQDGTHQSYLIAVAAFASDDVWAVGTTNFPGNGVIEHWNGQVWTETIYPAAEFRAVSAIGRNDVWAVGNLFTGGFAEPSLAVHFDGSHWRQIFTPNPLQGRPGSDQNWLTSLTAFSSTDVWATGIARDTDFGVLDYTFSLHWDGVTWRVIPSQNPGGNSNFNDFWASAALSPKQLWAVGETGSITFQPMVERLKDSAWRLAPTPSVEGALLALARVPSKSALVATGNQIVKPYVTGTLVEYFCRR